MLTPVVIAAAAALAATAVSAAPATKPSAELTEKEVTALKTAWGEGIVNIGQVHTNGGDYRAAAENHIEQF
ncbi:hypothetical protein AB1P65_09905 [Roseibium alexandrii]